MADHLRTQVRDALATLLTGLTTTGDNVYKSRVHPLANNKLPALTITTNDESVEFAGSASELLQRTLSIDVVARAKATADLDEQLDKIIKEVEIKINANATNYTLGGLVSGVDLKSIQIEINGDGEANVGTAVMNFEAIYFNQASTPDVSN